jgi:hypothetical protein
MVRQAVCPEFDLISVKGALNLRRQVKTSQKTEKNHLSSFQPYAQIM